MNTKTDEGLYEKARKPFISKASIDEFAGWATPRQVDAVHRLPDTEPANRERAKRDRLLRRARFPSSRVSTATTSRTSGSPTATCSMGSQGSVPSRARRTWCSTARPGAERRISRSGWA